MKKYVIIAIAALCVVAAFIAGRLSSRSNDILCDYLGKPVAPPADMNPAYTKEGLMNAIQLAAQNADITLKKVEIDDSEFPFLVGVVCEKGDYTKLTDQIKKVADYNYGGSAGSDTCHAMNIIPQRVFPRQASDHIYQRLLVRQSMLYDKISHQQ